MFKRSVTIRKIIICTGRTDLRKGLDSLVATVRLNFGLDPIETGTLFLFCGIKKDRIRALMYEGDGFVIATKRINNGRFCWPSSPGEARALTTEEYDRLMDGFPIESTIKPQK